MSLVRQLCPHVHNTRKNSSYLNILRAIRAGRCRERRYADRVLIHVNFRMHHFVVKFSNFSSPQAARVHCPPNQNPADPAVFIPSRCSVSMSGRQSKSCGSTRCSSEKEAVVLRHPAYYCTRVVHRSIFCDPTQPNPSAD